ncbi:hypothetical protein AMELA_G00022510 [Ameiurus melas]|uniref:DUF4939 domain-containing protein n=1 Tax=Ameiurus melas TaxID=219545 RepID=A0A7J6BDE4_AMEME|nr:hypothetical protein AMELA_G00022510 [Ameiurus melas]
MDVARGRRGRRAREPTLSIPAFDSMRFTQRIFEHMPARYDGVDYPDYFVRQCQEYFGSLCDPKPTEGQFIMFIMSRFVSFARSWAQWIVAEKPMVLEDVRLFLELFFVEFGEPRQKYDLDKVLREGTARTPTAPLLHVYYEQVRHQVEMSTPQPATQVTFRSRAPV